MNGFKQAGVTIHLVSPTIDTGDILYREKREITNNNPTIDII